MQEPRERPSLPDWGQYTPGGLITIVKKDVPAAVKQLVDNYNSSIGLTILLTGLHQHNITLRHDLEASRRLVGNALAQHHTKTDALLELHAGIAQLMARVDRATHQLNAGGQGEVDETLTTPHTNTRDVGEEDMHKIQ